jgi:hypothetical protein
MHSVVASFQSWKINKAAHHLAKLVCSQQLNKIWVGSCGSYPPCLLGIVNSELILFNENTRPFQKKNS